MERLDVVYVVKRGLMDSIELMYSLRSLKNFPHNRVFIVGEKPEWAKNVIHIPYEDYDTKFNNVKRKHRIIFNNPDISEDFIYMNDDFFILEKIIKVDFHRMGSLEDHVEYLNLKGFSSTYSNKVRKLLKYFPDGNSFETHTPIVYNKNKVLQLYKNYGEIKGLRTFYCNEYGIKGKNLVSENYINSDLINDCKFYGIGDFKIKKGQKFLSSSDDAVKNKNFLAFLQKKFPNKCKYEK